MCNLLFFRSCSWHSRDNYWFHFCTHPSHTLTTTKTLTPPAKPFWNFRIWGSIYDLWPILIWYIIICCVIINVGLIPPCHIGESSKCQSPLGMARSAFDQRSSLHFEQLPTIKPGTCTQSAWGPCEVKCSEGVLYIYTVTFLEAFI